LQSRLDEEDAQSYKGRVPAKRYSWGHWVIERSEVIGYKRRSDFAKAIGCSVDQLSRWSRMDVPPTKMRKGFDRSLASSLRTTRRMLFVDFVGVAPEDAAQVDEIPDSILPNDEGLQSDLFHSGQVLLEIAARLYPSESEKVAEYAITLVLAKGDRQRRAEFMHYARQLGILRMEPGHET
jgi:hypothetical protein